MFPVISMLRRSAMKVIYTATPDVSLEGVHFSLNVTSGCWEKKTKPFLVEISVTSKSPFERATKLCARENEIYENGKLAQLQYTLLLGQEIEAKGVRYARLGVLKGIFTTKKDYLIKEPRAHASTRRLPKGVVVDVR